MADGRDLPVEDFTTDTDAGPNGAGSVGAAASVGSAGSAGSVGGQERPGGAVLSVRDLKVSFKTDDGIVKAVDGASCDIYENEVLGIVGESGSGKSVSSMAVLGLLPKSAKITGEILFRGQDLLRLKEDEMQKLRGSKIAMVFQDALASLNPVFTVGAQIAEAIKIHHPDEKKAVIRSKTVELLDVVGIPNP